MKKQTLLGVHIAYWFYFLVIMEFISKLAFKNRVVGPTHFSGVIFYSNLLLFVPVFYFNYFFLLPRLFKRKKILLLVISWIGLALVYVALRFWVQEYLMPKYLGVCNYCYDNYPKTWGMYAVNNFFHGISYLIMAGTIIWFIDDWMKSEKQKVQLQKEKIDAERAFLQSQVNPHFLFNSLNNIYSMVYHQSENSLTAIQKLSGLMRYMTTDSSATLIALQKEISYLEDYIQLQQYRSKYMAVHFEKKGEPANKYIAPLMLIAFVENAFKHGVATDPDNPITIRLHIGENNLLFMVRNKINHDTKDKTSGIGLKNVERRLQLQYPVQHTLETKTEGDYFVASLLLDSLKKEQP